MGFLDSALGGSRRGGMSPLTMALLGTLAYRTMKGKGRLADILGTSRRAPEDPSGLSPNGSGSADVLGGLLGPGALSEGLNNLINRFRQNGQGDKAESWVSRGANKQISATTWKKAWARSGSPG
jgi:uncharacterized protein YidB (DUF937 family)